MSFYEEMDDDFSRYFDDDYDDFADLDDDEEGGSSLKTIGHHALYSLEDIMKDLAPDIYEPLKIGSNLIIKKLRGQGIDETKVDDMMKKNKLYRETDDEIDGADKYSQFEIDEDDDTYHPSGSMGGNFKQVKTIVESNAAMARANIKTLDKNAISNVTLMTKHHIENIGHFSSMNTNLGKLVEFNGKIMLSAVNSTMSFYNDTIYELRNLNVKMSEIRTKMVPPEKKAKKEMGFRGLLQWNDMRREFWKSVGLEGGIAGLLSGNRGGGDDDEESGVVAKVIKDYLSPDTENVSALWPIISSFIPQIFSLMPKLDYFTKANDWVKDMIIRPNLLQTDSDSRIGNAFNNIKEMMGLFKHVSPKDRENMLADSDDFTSKKAQFDKYTQHTIVKVIPGYLSQILAAITGNPLQVWDYIDQRFHSVDTVNHMAAQMSEYIVRPDAFKPFMELIEKNLGQTMLKEDGTEDEEAIKKYNDMFQGMFNMLAADPDMMRKIDFESFTRDDRGVDFLDQMLERYGNMDISAEDRKKLEETFQNLNTLEYVVDIDTGKKVRREESTQYKHDIEKLEEERDRLNKEGNTDAASKLDEKIEKMKNPDLDERLEKSQNEALTKIAKVNGAMINTIERQIKELEKIQKDTAKRGLSMAHSLNKSHVDVHSKNIEWIIKDKKKAELFSSIIGIFKNQRDELDDKLMPIDEDVKNVINLMYPELHDLFDKDKATVLRPDEKFKPGTPDGTGVSKRVEDTANFRKQVEGKYTREAEESAKKRKIEDLGDRSANLIELITGLSESDKKLVANQLSGIFNDGHYNQFMTEKFGGNLESANDTIKEILNSIMSNIDEVNSDIAVEYAKKFNALDNIKRDDKFSESNGINSENRHGQMVSHSLRGVRKSFIDAGMSEEQATSLVKMIQSTIGVDAQVYKEKEKKGIGKRIDGLSQKLDDLKNKASDTISDIKDDLSENGLASAISGNFSNAMETTSDTIAEEGEKVVESMRNMVKDAITASKDEFQIKSPSRVYKSIAGDVVDGFVEGVIEKRQAAIDAVTDMAQSTIDATKETLDINSPSKKFTSIGMIIGGSLIGGMLSTKHRIMGAAKSLAQSAIDGASDVDDQTNPSVAHQSSVTDRNNTVKKSLMETIRDDFHMAFFGRLPDPKDKEKGLIYWIKNIGSDPKSPLGILKNFIMKGIGGFRNIHDKFSETSLDDKIKMNKKRFSDWSTDKWNKLWKGKTNPDDMSFEEHIDQWRTNGAQKAFKGISDLTGAITKNFLNFSRNVKMSLTRLDVALFGDDNDRNNVGKVVDEYKKTGIGLTGIGAGVGLLGSLFLPGGPIIGSIIGGLTAMEIKTGGLRKVLFGEDGPFNKMLNGDNNVIKKLFNNIGFDLKKYPLLLKGGAIGGALGLLPSVAFGPFAGIALGAAGSFAMNMEGVQKLMFGEIDEDGFSKGSKFQSLMHKAFPHMKLGAGVGAIAGLFLPGGPVIGGILGATAALVKESGVLEKMLWGDEYSNRNGIIPSLTNFLKKDVFSHLGNIFTREFTKMGAFLSAKFVYPFKHIWKPLQIVVKGVAEDLQAWFKRSVKKYVDTILHAFGSSLKSILTLFKGTFVDKAFQALGKTLRGALGLPGNMLMGLGDMLMSYAQRRGYVDGEIVQKHRAEGKANKRGMLEIYKDADDKFKEKNKERIKLLEKERAIKKAHQAQREQIRNELMEGMDPAIKKHKKTKGGMMLNNAGITLSKGLGWFAPGIGEWSEKKLTDRNYRMRNEDLDTTNQTFKDTKRNFDDKQIKKLTRIEDEIMAQDKFKQLQAELNQMKNDYGENSDNYMNVASAMGDYTRDQLDNYGYSTVRDAIYNKDRLKSLKINEYSSMKAARITRQQAINDIANADDDQKVAIATTHVHGTLNDIFDFLKGVLSPQTKTKNEQVSRDDLHQSIDEQYATDPQMASDVKSMLDAHWKKDSSLTNVSNKTIKQAEALVDADRVGKGEQLSDSRAWNVDPVARRKAYDEMEKSILEVDPNFDFTEIKNSLFNDNGDWKDISQPLGHDIVKGIEVGMYQGFTQLEDVSGKSVYHIVNSFKEAAGIKSPAEITKPLGVFLSEGVAEGIMNTDAPEDAINKMLDGIIQTFKDADKDFDIEELTTELDEYLQKMVEIGALSDDLKNQLLNDTMDIGRNVFNTPEDESGLDDIRNNLSTRTSDNIKNHVVPEDSKFKEAMDDAKDNNKKITFGNHWIQRQDPTKSVAGSMSSPIPQTQQDDELGEVASATTESASWLSKIYTMMFRGKEALPLVPSTPLPASATNDGVIGESAAEIQAKSAEAAKDAVQEESRGLLGGILDTLKTGLFGGKKKKSIWGLLATGFVALKSMFANGFALGFKNLGMFMTKWIPGANLFSKFFKISKFLSPFKVLPKLAGHIGTFATWLTKGGGFGKILGGIKGFGANLIGFGKFFIMKVAPFVVALGAIKQIAIGFWNGVKTMWSLISKPLQEIKEIFTDKIMPPIREIFGGFGSTIKPLFSLVKDVFKTLFKLGEAIGKLTHPFFELVGTIVGWGLGKAISNIAWILDKLVVPAVKSIAFVVTGIRNFFVNLIEKFQSGLDWLKKGFQSVIESLPFGIGNRSKEKRIEADRAANPELYPSSGYDDDYNEDKKSPMFKLIDTVGKGLKYLVLGLALFKTDLGKHLTNLMTSVPKKLLELGKNTLNKITNPLTKLFTPDKQKTSGTLDKVRGFFGKKNKDGLEIESKYKLSHFKDNLNHALSVGKDSLASEYDNWKMARNERKNQKIVDGNDFGSRLRHFKDSLSNITKFISTGLKNKFNSSLDKVGNWFAESWVGQQLTIVGDFSKSLFSKTLEVIDGWKDKALNLMSKVFGNLTQKFQTWNNKRQEKNAKKIADGTDFGTRFSKVKDGFANNVGKWFTDQGHGAANLTPSTINDIKSNPNYVQGSLPLAFESGATSKTSDSKPAVDSSMTTKPEVLMETSKDTFDNGTAVQGSMFGDEVRQPDKPAVESSMTSKPEVKVETNTTQETKPEAQISSEVKSETKQSKPKVEAEIQKKQGFFSSAKDKVTGGFKKFKDGGVKGLLGNLGGMFGGAMSSITGLVGMLGPVMLGLKFIMPLLEDGMTALKEVMGPTLQRIKEAFQPVFDSVNEFLPMLGQAVAPLLEKAAEALSKYVVPVLTKVLGFLSENMGPAMEFIGELLKPVGWVLEALKPQFEAMFNVIGSMFKLFTGGFEEFWPNLGNVFLSVGKFIVTSLGTFLFKLPMAIGKFILNGMSYLIPGGGFIRKLINTTKEDDERSISAEVDTRTGISKFNEVVKKDKSKLANGESEYSSGVQSDEEAIAQDREELGGVRSVFNAINPFMKNSQGKWLPNFFDRVSEIWKSRFMPTYREYQYDEIGNPLLDESGNHQYSVSYATAEQLLQEVHGDDVPFIYKALNSMSDSKFIPQLVRRMISPVNDAFARGQYNNHMSESRTSSPDDIPYGVGGALYQPNDVPYGVGGALSQPEDVYMAEIAQSTGFMAKLFGLGYEGNSNPNSRFILGQIGSMFMDKANLMVDNDINQNVNFRWDDLPDWAGFMLERFGFDPRNPYGKIEPNNKQIEQLIYDPETGEQVIVKQSSQGVTSSVPSSAKPPVQVTSTSSNSSNFISNIKSSVSKGFNSIKNLFSRGGAVGGSVSSVPKGVGGARSGIDDPSNPWIGVNRVMGPGNKPVNLAQGHVETANYDNPLYLSKYKMRHNGIDIGYANPKNPQIHSLGNGVVERAASGYNGGYGDMIDIRHRNGMMSRYAHLESIGVKVGDVVKPGTIIGRGGNSGNSSGPHLHFEVRRPDNIEVDPQDFAYGRLSVDMISESDAKRLPTGAGSMVGSDPSKFNVIKWDGVGEVADSGMTSSPTSPTSNDSSDSKKGKLSAFAEFMNTFMNSLWGDDKTGVDGTSSDGSSSGDSNEGAMSATNSAMSSNPANSSDGAMRDWAEIPTYNSSMPAFRSSHNVSYSNPQFDQIINDVAKEEGVDPYFIAAVANKESGFGTNQTAFARQDYTGMMQVGAAATAEVNKNYPGPDLNRFNNKDNVRIGTRYLKLQHKTSPQSSKVKHTLAKYNWGVGNVRNSGYITNNKQSVLPEQTQAYIYDNVPGQTRPSIPSFYHMIKSNHSKLTSGSNTVKQGNVVTKQGDTMFDGQIGGPTGSITKSFNPMAKGGQFTIKPDMLTDEITRKQRAIGGVIKSISNRIKDIDDKPTRVNPINPSAVMSDKINHTIIATKQMSNEDNSLSYESMISLLGEIANNTSMVADNTYSINHKMDKLEPVAETNHFHFATDQVAVDTASDSNSYNIFAGSKPSMNEQSKLDYAREVMRRIARGE